MTKKIVTEFIKINASKKSLSGRKKIYDIGINDADYLIEYRVDNKRIACPFYVKWKSMIERCYSIDSLIKRPTYKGCTVCKEWLLFSNFKKWMEKQDWKNKDLDKDILVIGNKEYSPKMCCFVSHRVNSLMNDCRKRKGAYPTGVHKRGNNFYATCCFNGKNKHLGSYVTSELADNAYKKFKGNLIKKIAMLQNDDLIKHGLIRHAELLC